MLTVRFHGHKLHVANDRSFPPFRFSRSWNEQSVNRGRILVYVVAPLLAFCVGVVAATVPAIDVAVPAILQALIVVVTVVVLLHSVLRSRSSLRNGLGPSRLTSAAFAGAALATLEAHVTGLRQPKHCARRKRRLRIDTVGITVVRDWRRTRR